MYLNIPINRVMLMGTDLHLPFITTGEAVACSLCSREKKLIYVDLCVAFMNLYI